MDDDLHAAPPAEGAEDRDTEAEYISRYLDHLSRNWNIQNDLYRISSHQPVLGPVIVRGRQFVNEEVRRYTDWVFFQQTEFNANTARILAWMFRRIRHLEQQLEEQQKAASDEKTRPAGNTGRPGEY